MGTDRHLFGLYIMAQWLKMDPIPDLFNDKVNNNNTHVCVILFINPSVGKGLQ